MLNNVVIIGGGVAGLMCAAQWVRRGHRPVLLEKESSFGQHASGRNAASYSLHYGSPAVCEFARLSRETFRSPFWSNKPIDYLTPRGKVFLARSHQGAALQQVSGKLKAGGVPLQPISAAEAAERFRPLQLNVQPGDQYVFDSDHMDIDVKRLLRELETYLHSHGAEVRLNAPVAEVVQGSEGGWVVKGEGFQIDAAVVVNAAGDWADELWSGQIAAPMGIHGFRRTAAELTLSMDAHDVPMVHEINDAFFARPMDGNWFLSPSDATPCPHDGGEPDRQALEHALDALHSWFNQLEFQVIRTFCGVRSFSGDGEPKVGAIPGAPGLFACTGLGGYGMKIAPHCSSLVADAIEAHIQQIK